MNMTDIAQTEVTRSASKMVLPIVFAVALAHFLNDLIQACLPAIYPLLKTNYDLSFGQIGLISLVYQLTASLLQPWVGFYTDKYPKPYLLPIGMGFTLIGILLLALSQSFVMLLVSAAIIGIGSSTFHPEASRVARIASGGKLGTAQSAFQVGGNSGSAVGPLLAALIIIPNGQASSAWLMLFAAFGIFVLFKVSRWTITNSQTQLKKMGTTAASKLHGVTLIRALGVIGILMIAKFTYTVSISNYFTFYLIDKFGISIRDAQLYLFAFLGAVALGTFFGGPIGDRIGRNAVIWFSFLGMAPFALLMPYANLFWTCIFSIFAGLILSSAFSAMVVYAQEAVPGRVGTIAGLMFGVMFGISGIAAAGLGYVADHTSIAWVFQLCSYLPLLGILSFFLPKTQK
ncbi:MFS transporter [Acinetobacter schindleri]|uniref:MFS transporter n=1 Tax=Acinetobacter schindleri TaxID=108981 RepID=UPI003F55DA48